MRHRTETFEIFNPNASMKHKIKFARDTRKKFKSFINPRSSTEIISTTYEWNQTILRISHHSDNMMKVMIWGHGDDVYHCVVPKTYKMMEILVSIVASELCFTAGTISVALDHAMEINNIKM